VRNLRGSVALLGMTLVSNACLLHTEGESEESEDRPSLYPGDFSRSEEEKSFTVHPSEGLSLVLQNMIGGGRDGGSACVQLALTPSGTNAVYVLADQRSPSLQAVLQPGGPDGRILRLSSTVSVGEGVSLDGEVSVSSAGGLASAKVGGKWAGSDFHASGSLTIPGGERGPPHGEFSYHQSLGEGTGATAGGSLTALMSPGSLLPPVPQQLLWGTFASLSGSSRDWSIHARYGLQPNPQGPTGQAFSLNWWKRSTKNVEVGVGHSFSTLRYTEPVGSVTSLGFRASFPGASGDKSLATQLTAQADSNLTLGVSLLMPSVQLGSQTLMRTTLSTVLEHKAKDYKVGVGVELYN